MTTPWERIEDEDYRTWLLKRQITAEEYNNASIVSVVDRSALRTQFDDTLAPHQQQPGKRQLEEMIDDRIAKKQRVQRAKRPTRTLSYVSKSAAFDNVTILRRVWFNQPFFFDLINLPHGFHTDAFQAPGPLEKADENKVHHPRFIKELEKLVESFTSATATDESNPDTVLRQRVLWSKSGHWLKMDDGTTGVEPDFCFQERESLSDSVTPRSDKVVLPHSKYSVTVALEQKKKISHSDQVEAIDYGERLIVIQHRSDSYAGIFQFCEDRADIRWVHVFIGGDEFHSRVTAPERLDISGGTGQLQLLTMLCLGATDLGLNRPNPPHGFELQKKLEEGATSVVYEAQKSGLPTVLKVYKSGFEVFADSEEQILAHLARNNVAGIRGCEKVGPPTALAFPEVFDRIEVVTSGHMQQLLECLKGAHRVGVVHRDIRPENIMVDSSGGARLIDWGAAYMTNAGVVSKGFTGTFRYASDAVLEAVIEGSAREPKPADDLESLVRAVLAVNTVTIGNELAQLDQGDFIGARDFWRRKRVSNDRYEVFFEAAGRCDYDVLKELVFG